MLTPIRRRLKDETQLRPVRPRFDATLAAANTAVNIALNQLRKVRDGNFFAVAKPR
jgi:hypothetical protein